MSNTIIDHPLLSVESIEQSPDTYLNAIGCVFKVFGHNTQDSGNISYGVRTNQERYFVKTAGYPDDRKHPPKHPERIWLLRNAVSLWRKKARSSVISLYKSYLYYLSDEEEYEEVYLYETIPENSLMSPEDILERKEIESRLKTAIDSLSQKHRDVILMRFYEKLSYDEIAEKAECSVGTVKSRIYYAIEELKSKLNPKGFRNL